MYHPDGSSSVLEYRLERPEPGRVDLQLRGELADEDWTDRLESFLGEQYVDPGVSTIRLDVSGVDWLDLEGVATLIRLANHTRDRGKRFLLVGSRGPVREKLVRTGVIDYLS